MKTKEEMIETMARAIRDNYVEVHKQVGDMEYMYIVEDLELYKLPAKIALKALCGALPDTIRTHEFYNQLKQWGK